MDERTRRRLMEQQGTTQQQGIPPIGLRPLPPEGEAGTATDPEKGDEVREPGEPITGETLRKWMKILQKYKTGKAHLERRVVAAENWWKLRNEYEERKTTEQGKDDFLCKSGWLHNVIVAKHADAMEAYPEPVFLPREPGDRQQATMLTSVIPCILEQNKFEGVYSDNQWQKLKTGTAVYMVVWDPGRHNGLGDISIQRVDLLNIFWEPGITDIQDSRHLFYTYLEDKDELESQYPQLKGKIKGDPFQTTKFLYDDHVDTENKATVINHYYHRYQNGKRVLHYCKFVGDQVLYASEKEAPEGFYDHGLYPFVFDPLFPVEGSPCGYGFIDLAYNTQTQIDLMKTAFLKNTMAGATPRYFMRVDGSVNEEEFLDLRKALVHVNGNLGEDSLRAVSHNSLDGNYINVLEQTIREIRETTGNTESANGVSNSGATAASAIAALQEASGKGSRDSSKASYRAFANMCEMTMELTRQFYTVPRTFRITGSSGKEQFVAFSNDGIRPQYQGQIGQVDMGFRLPVFDIRITAQKKTNYARLSQNEMALQLYSAGVLDPSNSDQAAELLEMMDFEGKDELIQKVQRNGGMYQQLTAYQQLALALCQKYEPERAQGLIQQLGGPGMGTGQGLTPGALRGQEERQENRIVSKAREQSANAAQPG